MKYHLKLLLLLFFSALSYSQEADQNSLLTSVIVNGTFTGGTDACPSSNCTSPNDTYYSTYNCSSSPFYFTYENPLPSPEWVVVSRNITLWGRFLCEDTNTSVLIGVSIQGIGPVGFTEINPKDYPSGCSCPNCAYPLKIDKRFSTDEGMNLATDDDNQQTIVIKSNNNICLSYIAVNITYRPPTPILDWITPNGAPVGTNTSVLFWGSGFLSMNNSNYVYYCIFGDTSVQGIVIDPVHINCTAPSQNSVMVIPSTTIAVGQYQAQNQLPFYYYEEPIITEINPTQGPVTGGGNVTLIGQGFLNKTQIYCKFGISNYPNLAYYVSPTKVICNHPSDKLHLSGGPVTVYFSMNGVNYVSFDGMQYTFLPNTPPPPAPTPHNNPLIFPIWFWVILGVIIVILFTTLLIGGLVVRHQVMKLRSKAPLDETTPFNEYADGNSSIQVDRDPNTIPFEDIKQLRLIEKGSFGVIYKGIWNGTLIAVKKLPSTGMTDRLRAEFMQEAEMMKNLRHPNVLQYLGTSSYGKELCICMEFMALGSLYRLLHNAKSDFSLDKVKSISIDAARGVNYLHKQIPQIIHRDLKSHNLLIDESWRVKVCDFGLSRMIDIANATMTACGTPSWTAPEVLRNEKYTTKADVYSFGIVLWEMFSRRDPFPGMPPFQIVFAVGTQGLRPQLDPDWPAEWVQLMTDCWSELPDDRPPFDEILDRLVVMADPRPWGRKNSSPQPALSVHRKNESEDSINYLSDP